MAGDKEPNYYQETVKRMEPDVTMIDAGFFYASVAISLKRIADAMERQNEIQSEFAQNALRWGLGRP